MRLWLIVFIILIGDLSVWKISLFVVVFRLNVYWVDNFYF